MKKLLTLMLALIMMLTLVACGSGEPEPANEAPNTTEMGPDGNQPVAELPEEAHVTNDEEYYSQDVTITNSTGFEIFELYITPSTQEEFGEDLLGESTFPTGTALEFTTDAVGTADATWDIRAVDGEGTAVDFMGANFSVSTTLDITMGEDGATPTISLG